MTDKGRNLDEIIHETPQSPHQKLHPLKRASSHEHLGGIRWLTQNRHANIHLKDENGYYPLGRYFIDFEKTSKEYDEILKTGRSLTPPEYFKKAMLIRFKQTIHISIG